MDTIKAIASPMISDKEIMIYLLVESGMSYRDLSMRLGPSHDTIRTTYDRAKKKMKIFADAGLFQTNIRP